MDSFPDEVAWPTTISEFDVDAPDAVIYMAAQSLLASEEAVFVWP